jgi:hypothetical protein
LHMKIIAAALIFFLSLWLFTGLPAFAQAPQTPQVSAHSTSAKANVAPRTAPREATTHSFLDRKNSLAIAAVVASLAGDGWSTQRALAFPNAHEVNPVARPFVGSSAGEAAYSSAGLALAVGGIYLAHKTNHHRWERIAPFALAGWEGFLTGWNLHQVARARASH